MSSTLDTPKGPVFHVVLENRKIGPYDRRTLVGMLIKKTLNSGHVLIDSDGAALTMADLVGRRSRGADFSPNRTGSLSTVQAIFSANLRQAGKGALSIPAFRGEVELRVHERELRIAGRFRGGMRWREGRVKLALSDIAHAQVAGSRVDLWLRQGAGSDAAAFQRVALELFSPDAAGELVGWLPGATPWPGPPAGAVPGKSSGFRRPWIAAAALAALAALSMALAIGVVVTLAR